MWRAFFFAAGAMLVIVGVECLVIDSATFSSEKVESVQQASSLFEQPQAVSMRSNRTVRPPEWIPWSLIASGAVVILYALTLPARWGAKSAG